jgi:hypothetical protein
LRRSGVRQFDSCFGLLLLNLILDVQDYHSPYARVSQFQKCPDQPQHLEVFNALGHGIDSLNSDKAQSEDYASVLSLWNMVVELSLFQPSPAMDAKGPR